MGIGKAADGRHHQHTLGAQPAKKQCRQQLRQHDRQGHSQCQAPVKDMTGRHAVLSRLRFCREKPVGGIGTGADTAEQEW